MKLKYLLLCATLSVAFTSSAVLASENGKTDPEQIRCDGCRYLFKTYEIQSETDYKKRKKNW